MKSRPIALCGVLTALAVTALCLGGLIPASAFSAPLLAMAALLPVLEERGVRPAATTYAAAAILALLLAPNREAALVYLAFGWYPILRPGIARLRRGPLRLLARLAVCNGAAILLYGFLWKLLGLPDEASPPLLNALLLLLGNFLFLAADLALARLTALWHRKLKKYILRF